MQRLFSTFPNGRPGCGLILLRVACGAPLLILGSAHWWGWPMDSEHWTRLISAMAAVFILAGLWTPLAAGCQAVLQCLLALATETSVSTELLLALVGVSLVLLGPGAWSVDARLYGRKRIDIRGA
jgi:uncharacterized membrane protein YphA (DoxX/SURF4 family)